MCSSILIKDVSLLDDVCWSLPSTCLLRKLCYLTLQLVPSAAIGFAAYDSMKVWLRVPPRERRP
jgi:hypothetical protein